MSVAGLLPGLCASVLIATDHERFPLFWQRARPSAGAMKASDYIARFLAAQGVPQVFEVAGGMITHLLDSMHAQGAPRVVSVHHEQSAAFAAEGFARMTGIPGVAM